MFGLWQFIKKKKTPQHWEYLIAIHDEKMTVVYPSSQKEELSTKKVKKVLDEGDYYLIILAHMMMGIPCQKNLITEGSIAEFEQLFDGKIKRKKKYVAGS